MSWLRLAALFGALAVMIGAFGAHGLKDTLERTGKRDVFETGVHYHFFHVAALLAVGLLARSGGSGLLNGAGIAFTFGIVVFSGTLYVIGVGGPSWLGAITPIGGVALIVGWALLFWCTGKAA